MAEGCIDALDGSVLGICRYSSGFRCWISENAGVRRQKSAPSSVRALPGAAALASELGVQG